MYCNYSKQHWAFPEENPLCAEKGHALALCIGRLAQQGYGGELWTVLPDAELLQNELDNTRRLLESSRLALAKARR